MAGRTVYFVGLLIVGLVGLLRGANAATTYQVGGDRLWTLPPSNQSDYYQQWANNRTFQSGDSFVFNWTTGSGTHTATQVATKEEYDNCTKLGIISTDPVTITFNENGTHYFLCSVDNHCEQGQKVIIKIGDGISPSFAAPSLTAASALSALLISAAVFFSFN